MKSLINFEFRKLFRSIAFYVCCITIIALIVLQISLMWQMERIANEISNNNTDFSEDVTTSEEEKEVYTGRSLMMSSLADSGLITVIAVFVAIFVCRDFSEGTIKHTVSRGYSRVKIYFAKFMVATIGIVIMSVASIFAAFATGSTIWKTGESLSLSQLGILLSQLLCVLAYFSIFYCVAVCTKKSSLTITFGIVGPMIISPLITFADSLIKNNSAIKPSDFWIANCLNDISTEVVADKILARSVSCGVVYFILFVALGVLAIRKKEF